MPDPLDSKPGSERSTPVVVLHPDGSLVTEPARTPDAASPADPTAIQPSERPQPRQDAEGAFGLDDTGSGLASTEIIDTDKLQEDGSDSRNGPPEEIDAADRGADHGDKRPPPLPPPAHHECFECGQPAQEEHYVVPWSRGGTKTIPLCPSCCEKALYDDRVRAPITPPVSDGHVPALTKLQAVQAKLAALSAEIGAIIAEIAGLGRTAGDAGPSTARTSGTRAGHNRRVRTNTPGRIISEEVREILRTSSAATPVAVDEMIATIAARKDNNGRAITTEEATAQVNRRLDWLANQGGWSIQREKRNGFDVVWGYPR